MGEEGQRLHLVYADGRRFEVTRENTTLYTFLGRTAIGDITFNNESANHVFVQTDENEEAAGTYYFERFHPVYQDVAKFAIENSFPSILNMPSVPECDFQAYLQYVDVEQAKFSATLDGVFPEDFNA